MWPLIRTPLTLATVLLVSASAAHAAPVYYGAYVHGYINNANCGQYGLSAALSADCLFSGTDPRFFGPNLYGSVSYLPHTSATGALGDADESILAAASLATGDLSVQLSSFGASLQTTVTALMWETLTFHFADSAPHLVTVTMSGENWGTNTSTNYKLELFQPPDPNFFPQALTMAQGVIPLPTGIYSVSSNMLVQNGMTVAVLAGIGMAGSGTPGSSGIAWDPLVFSLDGGTFTSESGVFLTRTAPIPEPETLVLLATGLGAVARRRRPQAFTTRQAKHL